MSEREREREGGRERERERGVRGWVVVRQMGYYLCSLGWDPGLCRHDEERRKLNHWLLWLVWGSQTETEEERRGTLYKNTSVCVWVCVLSCWAERGRPLFRLEPYRLPNLRLTLINLRLCNSNLRRRFSLTSEACTVATHVVFPVWPALSHLGAKLFPHYLSEISQPHDLFSPPKAE